MKEVNNEDEDADSVEESVHGDGIKLHLHRETNTRSPFILLGREIGPACGLELPFTWRRPAEGLTF